MPTLVYEEEVENPEWLDGVKPELRKLLVVDPISKDLFHKDKLVDQG